MTEINFEVIKEHVLSRLERGLSPKLYYHGIFHTRDDVLPAATRLARLAEIADEDLLLLRTAALYHDIGYLETYREHEAAGARIASEELPQLGYRPDQVQKIANMIMATRMPQSPTTELEMLICDADLDSLGREDFFVTSHSLRLELMAMGIQTTVREWYTRQLYFLQGHHYHTQIAHELRDEGKQSIIHELQDVLALTTDQVK
jgi:uncharacterized protein